MDRYPVLFRCDATPDTGWESFWQCMTFAAALQRRRRSTYFLGNYAPFPLLPQITRSGNEYLPADHPIGSPEDAEITLRTVKKYQAAAVVVAGDNLNSEYLKTLSSMNAMLVVLDSQGDLHYPSKLVMHPFMGRAARDFDTGRGTQLLNGCRYSLVRSIFRRQRAIRSAAPHGLPRALVALGDNDFAGQTLQRSRELLNSSRFEKVSVAIRNHHPDYDALKALSQEVGNRMEILTEVNELATRLVRSQFALTSGDNWSLEMACVGIPQLILSQSETQARNAKALDAEGAATYLGAADKLSATALHDVIQYLLSDDLEQAGMARCARQLIDGRGQDRIINALEIMLHTRRAVGGIKIAA